MPALNISNIKDAKLGSTDLSAVYKGSALIWDGVAGELVLTRAYFDYKSSSGCSRGQSKFNLRVLGTHTYDEPGRQYNVQYNLTGGWQGSDSNWIIDTFTTPGVPFDVVGSSICMSSSSGQINTNCRMRFKLSDGTVTNWSYYFMSGTTDIPADVLQESEIEDG